MRGKKKRNADIQPGILKKQKKNKTPVGWAEPGSVKSPQEENVKM